MSDKESEKAPRPLVCPTCARPFEDEKRETGSGERTWLKFGGLEPE